jgi:hypothetical protein
MRNRGTQTLLLGKALFAAQLSIIAQFDKQFIHVSYNALFKRGVHTGSHFG